MKTLFPLYTIGHFINQPSNPTEFEITRFENMEEPDVDDIHKHTFYEILWIEKGTSTQTIDYKEYEIKPQSLFFISPNQVHQFEEWQPLSGGSILFTEDFFLLNNNDKERLFELSFLDNFYANPCVNLNAFDFSEIKQTIDLLTKEHQRNDCNATITQSLLHILLSQVQRCVDGKIDQSISKKYLIIFKQFKIQLETHFETNQNVSFYATQLHITPHHLNVISKAVTGLKASEVIRARSILEAKRFLTFTDLSVVEIAYQLHFYDSSYFAKAFKAETHQTPLQFKTQISEKYRKR
ncbi:helix-turn-helix transcriptional regulator [Flavobacterium sp.]|uniref:AraC family transcriptional regulator n=1 Tax=Flavobacterium sp. TaxID=239 RepID=UPI00286A9276|nr:helix-turn-helix transcriptional regulator [Flavobacterium sp.]